MKYVVSVQTGLDRVESFTIEASSLQEAWNKGIRISKCPVIINIRKVI